MRMAFERDMSPGLVPGTPSGMSHWWRLKCSIKRQDNTLVQALVLIYAVVSILGLLFGDILMGLVDPRISFAKKEGGR